MLKINVLSFCSSLFLHIGLVLVPYWLGGINWVAGFAIASFTLMLIGCNYRELIPDKVIIFKKLYKMG